MIALALVAIAVWVTVGIILSVRFPGLWLAAYAAILPFGSSISLPIGLPSPFNTATTFLGLIATFGLLLDILLRGRRAGRLHAPMAWWIIFFGVTALTLAWSVDPTSTANKLLVLASLLGLYVLTMLADLDRHALRMIEGGIAVSGAITGLYALALLLTGNMHVGGDGIARFQTAGGGGEGGDPNVTAASLILPLVVSLACGVRAGQAAGRRVAFLLAAALSAAAIVLTGSRGGMVAVVVAVIVLAINDRRPSVRVLYVIVPVLVAGITFLHASEDLQNRVQAQNTSGRSDIWRIGLDACTEHCWTGSGWSTFSDVFSERFINDADTLRSRVEVGPHSIWLRTPIEAGWLGFAVLLAALASSWRLLKRLPHAWRGPPRAALLGLLVTNSLLSNLDFKYFWLTLMYLGLVAATRATDQPAPSDPGARAPEAADVPRQPAVV